MASVAVWSLERLNLFMLNEAATINFSDILDSKGTATPETPSEFEVLLSENLVANNFFQFDEVYEPKIPTASLDIYRWIEEKMGRSDSKEINRGSAANLCFKRRQFQKAGAVAAPLTPRKRVNFAIGDLVEYVVLYFIERALVGPGKLYSEVFIGPKVGEFPIARGGGQPLLINIYDQVNTVTKTDTGIDITCHADGWGKLNSTGEWELIEVKSCSNTAFKNFIRLGPGDYINQAHTNMRSDKSIELGVKQTRFFFCNKEKGNLYDILTPFNQSTWEQVQAEFIKANSATLIKAPYQLKPYFPLVQGKQKKIRAKVTNLLEAAFPCSYCPYLAQCHGDFKMVWEGEKPHKVYKANKTFKKEELCFQL